jgi:hypothetical protein
MRRRVARCCGNGGVERDLLDAKGKPTGAADLLLRCERQAADLRSRLGLDPLARARLGRVVAQAKVDLARLWTDRLFGWSGVRLVSVLPSRAAVAAARDDLGRFAELAGHRLTDWQLAACRLDRRQTTIVAPRQTGKSWTLSALAVWWAFRRPAQVVLSVRRRLALAVVMCLRLRSGNGGVRGRASVTPGSGPPK